MTETPIYLELAPDPAFAFLHQPGGQELREVAVLICPPFGWDEVCSYRSRRAWAQSLADDGHVVMRLDLPGAGDSAGSPRDPGRLDAWTGAVDKAAGRLREASGATRVAAIGIGLGGMVAFRAAAFDAPIDDLVLWAVPARGHNLVRELIAFAQLEPGAGTLETSGEMAVGGFAMSAETVRSLQALDLTKLTLPRAERRRVLLLGRDGLAPDHRLHEHLTHSGVEVSMAAGDGYGEMMADPRLARSPLAVFTSTSDWLAEARGATGPAAASRRPVRSGTLELRAGEERVRETPVELGLPSGRLFAVLVEPVSTPAIGVCGVLLNAGAIRRIGPNRMWVELSRRWAARGVPSLRVDLHALGDSDGDERRYADNDEYYAPGRSEEALALLDELEARGLPGRFVLAGLCSGAYWSFRAALADERVAGAFAINLWSFFWSPSLVAERNLERARSLIRLRQSIESSAVVIARGTLHRWSRGRGRSARAREIRHALDRLAQRRTEVLLLFSEDEPLLDDLTRDGLLEQIAAYRDCTLDLISGADHTFRALEYQGQVHGALDRALERLLARELAGSSALSESPAGARSASC